MKHIVEKCELFTAAIFEQTHARAQTYNLLHRIKRLKFPRFGFRRNQRSVYFPEHKHEYIQSLFPSVYLPEEQAAKEPAVRAGPGMFIRISIPLLQTNTFCFIHRALNMNSSGGLLLKTPYITVKRL